jgi:HSP20 family protein
MVRVTFKIGPKRTEPKSIPEMRTSGNDSLRWRLIMHTHAWRPPTDVFETDEAFVVRVEIAGMKEDDFMIELNQNTLSIHGQRSDWPERRAYHQMEIYFGEFGIEMDLPQPVIASQVQADYENGFLRVTLPKERTLQIRIEDHE